MDGRLQLRVQRYGWDRASTRYETLWRDALAPATQGVLRLARLQPGERVLDVACGSGMLTRAALAAVGPQGAAVGCDVSAGMVAVAQATSIGCHFLRTDAQAVDAVLPPDHFDVVLCGLGLMYMPDSEASLAAMARCLRPGGRLVVSVWGERSACGWSGVFPIVDARVQSEVCPMFFRLGEGHALHTALAGARLQHVHTERIHAYGGHFGYDLLVTQDTHAVCPPSHGTLSAMGMESLSAISGMRTPSIVETWLLKKACARCVPCLCRAHPLSATQVVE
ncbi:class I SAM-dependent methyltransferase, partial [Hydrogenophaga sp.]|uniref:class I SAM-dependent methyltransferase n=1 Tax=Hydrogenophaga sp. TaxID=1904254 RepID=UPI003AF713F1